MTLLNPAPIALFAFNRPEPLKKVLEALAANPLASESHITFFCDGPRNDKEKEQTDAVRAVAQKAQGFASVTVIGREQNMGCAPSVIDGLRSMFAQHERVIVFEDDIICSPYTLTYLNEGLERYAQHKSVGHIDAFSLRHEVFPIAQDYPYDVYATPLFNCLGWGSWRDRFEQIDWDMQDYEFFSQSPTLKKAYAQRGETFLHILQAQMQGKISSWAIRLDYANFKMGRVGISPIKSYMMHLETEDGTHVQGAAPLLDTDITLALPAQDIRWLEHIFIDEDIMNLQRKAYKGGSVFKEKLKSRLEKLHLLPLAMLCRNMLRK